MIRIIARRLSPPPRFSLPQPRLRRPTIFVSNEKDNTVTVVDGETLRGRSRPSKSARRPRGIMLSPDFKELFVAAGDGDIMDVIDTKTLEEEPRARIRVPTPS